MGICRHIYIIVGFIQWKCVLLNKTMRNERIKGYMSKMAFYSMLSIAIGILYFSSCSCNNTGQ